MFKSDKSILVDSIERQRSDVDKNYTIQKNNYVSIKVYTNNGERLIDPNFELSKGMPTMNGMREDIKYLVRKDGFVNIPMIGEIKLEGYKIFQADSILRVAFSKYYYDPFVITKILNNRVIVLGGSLTGSTSGAGKVILLENENVNLIEVLAQYGGMGSDTKAHNIRLIRGDLKNPDVQVIDLSTIEGLRKASLDVKPNDIIYIEPVIRLLPKTLQDIYPIVSVLSTLLSLIVIVITLKK